VKITIVYDSEVKQPGLKGEPQILFDAGADGSILLHNIRALGFDPGAIGVVVISHPHWDHVGGLLDIMEASKDAELYLTESFTQVVPKAKITKIKEPLQIRKDIFSTGELKGIEQSLAINTSKGFLVVVGCSHPGVGNVIDAASKFGKVYGIVGGFHGSRDFDRLSSLSLICPCHCARYKSEIKHLFSEQCIECGAGLVLEL